MTGAWRPRSARSDVTASANYEALHEGLPPWLMTPVLQWVARSLRLAQDEYPSDNPLHVVAIVAGRIRLPLVAPRDPHVAIGWLCDVVASNDEERALDIADAVLNLNHLTRMSVAGELAAMLELGGSAWMVAQHGDRLELQRRVDETVSDALEEISAHGGSAANHLRAAWSSSYGRHVDSSASYHSAVRAVEAAARPFITPTDGVATLGKMIEAVKAKPTKWRMRFTDTKGHNPVETLLHMLQLLWKSQCDRHGTDDPDVPLSVSTDEARDAVHLATTLVQWFQSGAVERVS